MSETITRRGFLKGFAGFLVTEATGISRMDIPGSLQGSGIFSGPETSQTPDDSIVSDFQYFLDTYPSIQDPNASHLYEYRHYAADLFGELNEMTNGQLQGHTFEYAIPLALENNGQTIPLSDANLNEIAEKGMVAGTVVDPQMKKVVEELLRHVEARSSNNSKTSSEHKDVLPCVPAWMGRVADGGINSLTQLFRDVSVYVFESNGSVFVKGFLIDTLAGRFPDEIMLIFSKYGGKGVNSGTAFRINQAKGFDTSPERGFKRINLADQNEVNKVNGNLSKLTGTNCGTVPSSVNVPQPMQEKSTEGSEGTNEFSVVPVPSAGVEVPNPISPDDLTWQQKGTLGGLVSMLGLAGLGWIIGRRDRNMRRNQTSNG